MILLETVGQVRYFFVFHWFELGQQIEESYFKKISRKGKTSEGVSSHSNRFRFQNQYLTSSLRGSASLESHLFLPLPLFPFPQHSLNLCSESQSCIFLILVLIVLLIALIFEKQKFSWYLSFGYFSNQYLDVNSLQGKFLCFYFFFFLLFFFEGT